MPKRTDIHSILIIGAGPIVIGQACEFDYSGAQACKALREEGYRVILVNSNPATIMTDPHMADATYVEPIRWEVVAKIIEKERPEAILPTMGGQTALNCALDLAHHGVLEKFKVTMIGATKEAIEKAENRLKFREAMQKIGLEMPKSGFAYNLDDAFKVLEEIGGFPVIIRPSFTLGGAGGGIAYNREELEEICARGLELSPTHELQIDQSILGWKEYELEVVRDHADNCIVVCSIENLDPVGIHTGDSITVAPAQTLTDKEYQIMRDASFAVLREIGVDTGGSNVQFAVHPDTGQMMVIEMNPRVSRSSALASKATGFPIAKVAAKLAVGYTLNELRNELTDNLIPISFEPSLDYVVTKIPRFNFEKFPQANPFLTTQMKSVGEVMAIGRTFQESFQKALRGLEVGCYGLSPIQNLEAENALDLIRRELRNPGWNRIWYVADAFRADLTLQEVQDLTKIDPWFLLQIKNLIVTEKRVSECTLNDIDFDKMRALKRQGFSDHRLAELLGISEHSLRKHRHQLGVHPVYKHVDSCAGEFPTHTAYLYSTYEEECEAQPTKNRKIMVLGGGPNRIGQGIEFDYCCVHAALAMREDGYETIMINCNPETVSTDPDISDRLYFEPLTLEDILEIVALENPLGVIVHYGGQTPLRLARDLEAAGVPIIGTSPDAIDRAEDRERFQQVVHKLELKQPANGIVRSMEEGIRLANIFAYPLVARPSYVLGGRAMEVIHNEADFIRYMKECVIISNDSPLLLDHFLDNAIEVDIDAICDGKEVLIGGVLEHIEQAGIHSGDSSCSLPSYNLNPKIQEDLRQQMKRMAFELGVVGLFNAQFAIQDDVIYVLEVNPRASRTVPFVSKVTGLALAKIGARCMAGTDLATQGFNQEIIPPYYAIKRAVFPFDRFPGVDPILGPEMRSTGEVIGIGHSFGEAFAKGQLGGGQDIPQQGKVFISVRDNDKPHAITLAKDLVQMGFTVVATHGTANAIEKANIPCQHVNKFNQGRPNIVDMIKNDEIVFIINTTEGKQAIADSLYIRDSAIQHQVCYTTTIAGGKATYLAMQHQNMSEVHSLQELHKRLTEE